jgi:hypothetical protein
MKGDLDRIRKEMAGTVVLQGIEQTTKRQGDIRALAETHHLRVDEVKPGTPAPHRRCTAVPIILSGSGGAADCAAFLHDLRTQFRDVSIVAMRLAGDPENPDRPAKFMFNFVWYAAAAGGSAAK